MADSFFVVLALIIQKVLRMKRCIQRLVMKLNRKITPAHQLGCLF
ncbi:hypothetical protein H650_03585 [Enterobacter sp. R4-368]|nr:hypothetical protein H650_03585 [Enterobacter sp. R4-368]